MMETFYVFPWNQQIQDILQNIIGCHSAKILMFGSQNDSLTPGWISPWSESFTCPFILGTYVTLTLILLTTTIVVCTSAHRFHSRIRVKMTFIIIRPSRKLKCICLAILNNILFF